MTVVIGTAGHIDHGKTSLLRALTGIDADRLPEERRRGMTIDVGYAHLDLPTDPSSTSSTCPATIGSSGTCSSVPARSTRRCSSSPPTTGRGPRRSSTSSCSTRSGSATAVAVDDQDRPRRAGRGRPRSRSSWTGSSAGRRWPEPRSWPSRRSVATGIDDLRAALVVLRDRVAAGDRRRRGATWRRLRLAIDRVFSVKGRGVGGHRLAPRRPARPGRDRSASSPAAGTVRVREVQVHGADGRGGRRAAVGSRSTWPAVELDAIERGDVLTDDPTVRPTDRLLAILRPPARLDDRGRGAPWPPPPGAVLRLHLGTAALDATSEARPIRRRRPARRPARRRRSVSPDPWRRGRRPVRPSRPVAGRDGRRGRRPRRGAADRRLASSRHSRVARRPRRGLAGRRRSRRDGRTRRAPRHRARRRSGRGPGREPGRRGWLVAADVVAAVDARGRRARRRAARARAARAGRSPGRAAPNAGPRRSAGWRRPTSATAGVIVDALVEALVDDGPAGRTGMPSATRHGSTGDLPDEVRAAMDRLEAALAVPAPPSLREAVRRAGCPDAGVRALESTGRIVRVDARPCLGGLDLRDARGARARPRRPARPLTPAALRDATGTSRKYVMALLEDLDRAGILQPDPGRPRPRSRPAPPTG